MFMLYTAAIKRFPDPNGLKYWIDVYSSGINTNKVVSASFVLSDEFRCLYGENVSNGQFIMNMYKNVFDREAYPSGHNYFLEWKVITDASFSIRSWCNLISSIWILSIIGSIIVCIVCLTSSIF